MKNFFLLIWGVCCTLSLYSEKARILVNPFQNDGLKEYSWISAGLTNRVVAVLGKVKGIQVITEESRKLALKEINLGQSGILQESTTIQVGEILGANQAVSGNYSVIGKQISVTASLSELKTGSIIRTSEFTLSLSQLLSVHKKLVYELLREKSKIDIKSLQSETQPSKLALSAYKFYAKGLEVMDAKPLLALGYFEKSLQLDSKQKEAYTYAGYVASQLANYSQAKKYFLQAEKLYRANGKNHTQGYAEFLRLFGSNYYYLGENEQSFRYYKAAQQIYTEKANYQSPDYADLLYAMGSVQAVRGQTKQAFQYYKQSKAMYDRIGMKRIVGYANLMYGIGYLYLLRKDFARSLLFFRFCEDSYQKNNMRHSKYYGDTLFVIGRIYEIQGKNAKALLYIKKSLKVFRNIPGKNKKVSIQKAKQVLVRLENKNES
ncbi:MAG: tetratricopeptide repeat protein [Spirochaetota bacterium]